jgi:hypothetical protein
MDDNQDTDSTLDYARSGALAGARSSRRTAIVSVCLLLLSIIIAVLWLDAFYAVRDRGSRNDAGLMGGWHARGQWYADALRQVGISERVLGAGKTPWSPPLGVLILPSLGTAAAVLHIVRLDRYSRSCQLPFLLALMGVAWAIPVIFDFLFSLRVLEGGLAS